MLHQMRSARKFILVVFIVLGLTFVGGFLLYETSGLISAPVTSGTKVAEVEGQEISYMDWQRALQQAEEAERQRRGGQGLDADERRQLEDRVFNEMVTNILLEREYERRGITATDEEIRFAADNAPPEALMQSPDLQTDGRFDIEKYRRFRRSPMARQSGLNLYLESYYRDAIRRSKLIDQVSTGAYLTDARLWQVWKDEHDSVQVTFVALPPDRIADDRVQVSDDEIEKYIAAHRKELERPGRAVLSIVRIPRTITAADTAAARDRAIALRNEILGGATFEDIARAESADTVSGAQGGSLGRGPRGRFVPEFENAAFAVPVGQISQPVRTQFGFHLIKVDERKGDTIAARHILVPIEQREEARRAAGKRADDLARIAANKKIPSLLDSAAKALGLPVERAVAIEGRRATLADGSPVPDVGVWAFRGAQPGETGELVDSDAGYYLARLDSLTAGGVPPTSAIRNEIADRVRRDKKIDQLVLQGDSLARAAAASSLEAAAQARGLSAVKTGRFNRTSGAPGLGTFNEAIGTAFGLPVGAISHAIRTTSGVYVLRVDAHKDADRAAFDAQKASQRTQLTELFRRKKVQDFLANLRANAKVEDHRNDVARRSTESTS